MEKEGLKLFKILYSGELKSVESQNILQYFSEVNIIAFYVRENKRLYIWVGNEVSRTLKSYIPNMRETFSEEFPFLRVLRYITIESMEETFDFLRDIGISKQEIHDKIRSKQKEYQKHEKIALKIKDLKNEADESFQNKNFKEAIELAKKVLNLAKEINDETLINDQENFIAEAKARQKAEAVLEEIREEKKIFKQKLYSIEENGKKEKIIELHEYIEEFKNKYRDYLELSALENIREMLLKAEKICNEYESSVKKEKDQEKFLHNVNELREKSKNALNDGQFVDSYNYFKKIKALIEEKE